MTRILVVDDSPLMRRVLGAIFRAADGFDVETARDGAEAIEKLHGFAPDVITLDIQMPGMDGLACLDRIMLERPTPVVMVSALTTSGANATLEAMALGAVDFIVKPGGAVSLAIDALAAALVEKVRGAAQARLSPTRRLTERIRRRAAIAAGPASHKPSGTRQPAQSPARSALGDGLVVVGCSTGGPQALEALLAPLSGDFPWPIVIAQHMPAAFTGPLAQRLNRLCALDVTEVSRPVPLETGYVYIARGDADVIVARRSAGIVAMAAPSSPEFHWHPSVDRLVASAMETLPPARIIGVLMTGMGSDGAARMQKLREAGGQTIAEDHTTAVIWGMPGSLVRAGGASVVAPLHTIADALVAMLNQQ